MMRRIAVGALSYLLPTFALGFVWHLVAFKDYCDGLAMYRPDESAFTAVQWAIVGPLMALAHAKTPVTA